MLLKKDLIEDINPLENTVCSSIRSLDNVKMKTSPKLIYRLNQFQAKFQQLF